MTTELQSGKSRPHSLRAVQRPQGEAVFTGEMRDEIADLVARKLRWNMTRYPFLRTATDHFEDAVAVGVASIWQSLSERSLDWWSLSRIQRLELATPAVSYLQRVARSRRTSRTDAAAHGEFRNRYLHDKGDTFVEGDPFKQSWFDGPEFASQSAEEAYFTEAHESVDFTEEVANELFDTPGERWTDTQLRVLEALAYHRGTSVDMGRMLFADHGGRSTPENLFTSHKQVIQRKIARARARQEAV